MFDLRAAHRHGTNNQAEIEASQLCGCFFCMQIFPASEVTAWTGAWEPDLADEQSTTSQMTALCPQCGSESVIGDKSGFAITAQFLNQMHQAWFQKTMIIKPAAKR